MVGTASVSLPTLLTCQPALRPANLTREIGCDSVKWLLRAHTGHCQHQVRKNFYVVFFHEPR